jgi:hypothetical protein
VNRKVHAGFGPADGGSTVGKLAASTPSDWHLLGFAGPRKEAEEIKSKIGAFLQTLKLTMSAEKTLITHATTESARFLGYDINVMQNDTKITLGKNGVKRRAINGRIRLGMPVDARKEQMAKCTRRGRAIHRPELLYRTDYEITYLYGVEFQGLVNYYSLANNVSKVAGKLKYFVEGSLLKTLAHKHKTTLTKMAKKYKRKVNGIKGIVVTILRPGKKPLRATFGTHPIRVKKWAEIVDTKPTPYRVISSRSELERRLTANQCEVCGATDNVQVHHIRALKDVQKRYEGRANPPRWAVYMMERKRKTIVVCRKCHYDIHSGRYDGQKLTQVEPESRVRGNL